MNYLRLSLAAAVAAMVVLTGCSTSSSNARQEPTYEDAANNKFMNANREAINRLVAGVDLAKVAGAPVLVATVVNVNDLRRAAPLGRTLSEQYASAMVANGFNVKELKLRGDVFVREETGELMLSREVKDIARLHSAALVVVGTYSTAAQLTYVSLKLVRTDTGQIMKGHDYALPHDADVTKLLQAPR
ncbi:MAG: FlgO family outer membrane protein [Pseudomonadota bacterium]|nr:FlgO family outer membrane protein [Pseudomonadota bacterium]